MMKPPAPANPELPRQEGKAAQVQAMMEGRRRALDSADYRDGLDAFHRRQPPVFSGR